MPAKQKGSSKSERQKLLSRIHLGAKQRGLNEGEYRAIVAGHSKKGEHSAANLGIRELRSLARYLAPTRSERSVSRAGSVTIRQQGYIRALWRSNARSADERSLNAWLLKHWKVGGVWELDKEKASQVIVVLERWSDAPHAAQALGAAPAKGTNTRVLVNKAGCAKQ